RRSRGADLRAQDLGERFEIRVPEILRDDAEPQIPERPVPAGTVLPELRPEGRGFSRAAAGHPGWSRGPMAVWRRTARRVASPAAFTEMVCSRNGPVLVARPQISMIRRAGRSAWN